MIPTPNHVTNLSILNRLIAECEDTSDLSKDLLILLKIARKQRDKLAYGIMRGSVEPLRNHVSEDITLSELLFGAGQEEPDMKQQPVHGFCSICDSVQWWKEEPVENYEGY